MPERGQFPSADNYYATALHELGHWTGHPSRLDRDLSNPFGSEGYAKEELRAEISSMILGNELGIGHDPGQHVAYVGSWIKVLQEDPLEIFRAAADAEKIQAFVLAFEQQQVQDHQVDTAQLGQEQAEVLAHIQEAHKNANPGYSALESWQTLERTAEANGLKAMLRWSNAGEYEADIRVEYQDTDGKLIPVHSELHSGDGKAVSCIEGQRVPGTGMTSDDEWQTNALNSAIATARHRQEQQEAKMEQGQQLPQQEITQQQLTAEQWVLDKLSSDLRPAIGRMNERQLDTVQSVLDSMHPMGNNNPFWQRHEPAAEAMYQDVDQVEKQIFDATDAVSNRREVLQGQGLVQADDMQQAVEQARLREAQVRQNPNSTDEDISAAKEERKNAEVALALNDPEMQRRIAELEKSEARSEQSSTSVAKEKTWLAVPYEQRDEAKQVAGKLQSGRPAIGFDKQTKCWYAQPGANLEKLQKWLPENQVRQAPAMEPREEFAQVMKEAGLVVDGEHPIMDGKWHRVPVEGGSKGNTSGAYRGFELEPGEKGVPAGTIQNHRTGFQSNWKAKGYALSEGDKASFNAEAAQRQAQREQERLVNQARAVKAIGELLAIAPQATADHTYLQNKEARPGDLKVVPADTAGLPADSIILIGKNARESKALREANPDNLVFTAGDLLLTAQDSNGNLKAAQSIRANGTKMFAKGTEKHQNFHVVGGAGLEALQAAPAIVIGEGYATADTLSQSLGYATVAAFDSGNLPHVAAQMREQFPDKPILIAGDNDLHQELIDGKNPGRTKAQEAAKSVEGKAIFPIFAPGEQAYPAGVEPIDPEKARANKLTPEQQEAINQMKRFTDFNDLATKSSLGREALDRQVRSEVGLAIEKHQERIEQKRLEQVQTQAEKQQPRRAMSR